MTVYVLDTSVLLAGGAQAFYAHPGDETVLPMVVLGELNGKKSHPELGATARSCIRALDDLMNRGDLRTGILTDEIGGKLRIEENHIDQSDLPEFIKKDTSHDTRILAVCSGLNKEQGLAGKVVLVSKDLQMRVVAHALLGLPVEDYTPLKSVRDNDYSGVVTLSDEPELAAALFASADSSARFQNDLPANTGLIIRNGQQSVLGVVVNESQVDRVQDYQPKKMKGRSAEQQIALHHLREDGPRLVSLGGPAGTGKSALAIAAGLDQVERGKFERVIVFRPVDAVGGQSLGFLPGSEAEKMEPWKAAVFDAIETVTTKPEMTKLRQPNSTLEVLPLTHIRGRTLHKAFVVVDEAQSLEPAVILAALSRLGTTSRVVLCWDVAQRDNLRVGRHDGVQAVVDKLIGNPMVAHVSLRKSERSPLAALASQVLDEMIVN